MSRILFSTAVTVPELPRVRFLKRMPAGWPKSFEDVTLGVTSVRIVSLSPDDSLLALERIGAGEALVWSTKHQSIEEARWQAQFEYGIEPAAWSTADKETGRPGDKEELPHSENAA